MNQCIVCGKETKNKKYCSIECKTKAMSKPKGKCLYCGKELDRCEVKYCSSECYQLDKKRKYEKSLVYNSCIICGAPTLNEKYCSMKCMGQDSSRHEFAIKNLKNEHIWTPAEIQYLEENYGIISPNEMEEYLGIKKANIVAYASKHNIKSKRKWTEEEIKYLQEHKDDNISSLSTILNKSNFAIQSKFYRLNNFQDQYGSSLISIQEYVTNLIKELKISYLEEVQIGKFRTDILVYNLDIEVQGTIWHVDPRFFNRENLSDAQLKRIDRDKRKKEYFKTQGIEILYLWEYDIVSNPQKIKQIIIDKLKEKKLI